MSRYGCKVNGCTRPVKAAGFCSPHYQRNRRYGDPLAGTPIEPPLGERKTYRGRGKLTCHICGEPVNTHPIGAHSIGRRIVEARVGGSRS